MTYSPPSSTLTLDLVYNDNGEMGSYGPVLREITRVGSSTRRMQLLHERGDRVTVRGIKYHDSETSAQDYIDTCAGLQGEHITLASTLDSRSYTVYLHRVTAAYVRIGSTDPDKRWRAEYQLLLERTQ